VYSSVLPLGNSFGIMGVKGDSLLVKKVTKCVQNFQILGESEGFFLCCFWKGGEWASLNASWGRTVSVGGGCLREVKGVLNIRVGEEICLKAKSLLKRSNVSSPNQAKSPQPEDCFGRAGFQGGTKRKK